MQSPYPILSLSKASPQDFFLLLKPRVMSLVVFTAFVGFSFHFSQMHPFLIGISLLAIALGAGASGALNMAYDADIDKIMERTQSRPIPQGIISAETARDFGLILSVLSVTLLFIASNLQAACFLAFTIFFYAVIYTVWLKRSTPENIVIGGLSGAFPPLISAIASTGNITEQGLVLCGIIFLWTPPHFWALALVKKKDYDAVNIPMMPNVKGDLYTIKLSLCYWVGLFLLSFYPLYSGWGDIVYASIALLLGGGYGFSVWQLKIFYQTDQLKSKAMRSFFLSIFYLFSLFFSILIEQFLKINFL